jgi:hypothetical protein
MEKSYIHGSGGKHELIFFKGVENSNDNLKIEVGF